MTPPSPPTIPQLFDLSGRVALVTGGAGYLGRAISAALAEAGATVAVSSRSLERAEDAVAALPAKDGVEHFAVQLDHKDEASLRAGFAKAVQRAGGVDILFNNGQGGTGDDWTNITGEGFRDQMANAAGYFLLARVLRDHAVERGKPAAVIMLGSMYGVVGSYPDAYEGVCPASSVGYHALKGGVIHMARHLAVYWAPDNVRVNCLSPGPFPSETAPPVMVERLCRKSPMSRMGLPHELKGAALLLASDAGSYITGQNLIVDGGWTAW
ncbi:MAG: SDR family NAD(P)-dependent oxidoreductase [Planctomycetaceae bacterium]